MIVAYILITCGFFLACIKHISIIATKPSLRLFLHCISVMMVVSNPMFIKNMQMQEFLYFIGYVALMTITFFYITYKILN